MTGPHRRALPADRPPGRGGRAPLAGPESKPVGAAHDATGIEG
ncbi:hypothetical protein [Streptomyces sp. NPDC003401]